MANPYWKNQTQVLEKSKALLIVHDVYQEDNQFPLGVGYLAAVLKRMGADVTVYCMDVYHYTNEDLGKLLDANAYDLIGIGFLAARFKETILDLCEVVNKFKKNAWLVMGGHGPSPIPEYVLSKTKADIVCIGEAEETICELLKCKLEEGDLYKIRGIAFREGDNIVVNERRDPIKDLDIIPFPEWSFFPIEKYTTSMVAFGQTPKEKSLAIITSRGCINRCNFCYRMERGIRLRSINNVIEEIKILKGKYGVSFFYMNDELFIYPKKKVFEFKEALEKNDLQINIYCQGRVDVIDEEVLTALKESGCKFINYGLESSDQKVLDIMNKRTSVEENLKAVELTKKMGIGIGLNFIWGNIGDTETSLKNNVKLIKKYNTYTQIRTIRPVTPYPGSDLYYEAIKKGLLAGPQDFFDKYINSDLVTVNFTDMSDGEFYKLLFEANQELIVDHFEHTTNNMDEANKIINNFYDLYFKGNVNFRGSRHYPRKSQIT